MRGVDSGAVLKALPIASSCAFSASATSRAPLIYGTTAQFLTFFGLRSLADLPTLREFAELTDESKITFEREMAKRPRR